MQRAESAEQPQTLEPAPVSTGEGSRRSVMRTRSMAVLCTLVAGAVALAGCGSSDGGSSGAAGKTVTIATHDSWAMSKQVLADFTKQTGITVKIQPHGDAGELTNKLVLTKGHPLADGVFGIDNTFASRAVDEGVLATYDAKQPASAKAFALPGEAAHQLTPIDYGDVCVNIDDGWFV